jgi:hypothetical protein
MRKKYPTCKALISACYKSQNTLACVPAAIYCNSAMINPFQETGLNIYDVRRQCDTSKTPLCYEIIGDIETYLNLEDVQAELGVERKYEGCKMDINMKVRHEAMVAGCLDGIPAMFAHGLTHVPFPHRAHTRAPVYVCGGLDEALCPGPAAPARGGNPRAHLCWGCGLHLQLDRQQGLDACPPLVGV